MYERPHRPGVPQLVVAVHRLFGPKDVRGDASLFQGIQRLLANAEPPVKARAYDHRGRTTVEQFLYVCRADAGLVLDAAEARDLRMEITGAVAARFDEAIEAGHGEEDMAAVYEAARSERG